MGSKQLQMTVNAMDSVQDATLGKTTRVAQGKSAQTANLITGGPARNVQAFLNALQVRFDPLRLNLGVFPLTFGWIGQDETRSFITGDLITTAMATGGDGGKQHLFSADDLLGYNVGTLQEQFQKQKRVLACVLELGLVVSNLQGYMGVCIDEINLGTLHPGTIDLHTHSTLFIGTFETHVWFSTWHGRRVLWRAELTATDGRLEEQSHNHCSAEFDALLHHKDEDRVAGESISRSEA